jgi:hypothetical protein
MIKLIKKAIELLDSVTSVPYSRKGLGYTIGRGLDAVLPFTCYSYWFSCYFDRRGKLMKALQLGRLTIYLDFMFNCSSIQYIHVHTRPYIPSLLTIKRSVSKPRSWTCRQRPSQPNNICAMLTQSCFVFIHEFTFVSLKYARLPTTKFICKFAAERWKLIKIPHPILLKGLTRTIT